MDEATIMEKQVKLGRKLAYLLRYGAEVEGLAVEEGGWVNLSDLCQHPLLAKSQIEFILREITESTSSRGQKRFEIRDESEKKLVRACYSRKFDRSPRHEGSKVLRLMEITLRYVCDNIRNFDLLEFQDEYLMRLMLKRLQSQRKFNNSILKCVLGKTLTRLSLEFFFVTESTLLLLSRRCPNLECLTLKDCSYIITDQKLDTLFHKLTKIQYLDLSYCKHLTDRTLLNMHRMCPNLKYLNIMGLPKITGEALVELVRTCPKLRKVDIRDNRSFQTEMAVSMQSAKEVIPKIEDKNITIIYGKFRKDMY
ncbi:F-box protein SKP2B-like [Oopsacas minuta]|uniref:2'-phosphotransferase n=1 Tax=Oopsacas minuta TaxID=111878 RepID=A0AAV7K0M7_9METZ|nr:F-box protein SKP2B-like [Oopsacas minuta]